MMKHTNKFLLLFGILFFWCIGVQAQSNPTIDSLLCKEWRLIAYEEGGEKFPASPQQKNDKMIFYFNHQVKSYDGDLVEIGVWSYNEQTKKLTITDKESKEKLEVKVIKLTKLECVLEFKENGESLKIFMEPVRK
jgi:hypothetical protein